MKSIDGLSSKNRNYKTTPKNGMNTSVSANSISMLMRNSTKMLSSSTLPDVVGSER